MSKSREEWLNELTESVREMFIAVDAPLPAKIRASCGFPSKGALAKKAKRIGEAWSSDCSDDQHFETFVSPMLADAVQVAETQVHELCHCAAGLKCGHKKPFTTIAKAMGLEGKMTATHAGDDLKKKLESIIETLGPYPHAKLFYSSSPKKQSTRMNLIKCPECGYQVRTTKKWMEVGMPTCPCGTPMAVQETKGDDDGVPSDGDQ